MKSRFAVYLPLLLTLVTLCSGCVVTCINAPFDLSRAEEDKALIGEWLFPESESVGSVEFRSLGKKEFQVFLTKGRQRKGPMFTGYSGQAGGRSYMWLALAGQNEQKADVGHILVRYEARENELHMWLLDPTRVRAAVVDGRLKGRGIGGTGEMELNGSAEEMSRVISDEEFWKKEEPLRRIKVK
jgi:hypothetical protein